jgi:hypothetical protein
MFIQVSLIKYGKRFLSLHLAEHRNLEETKCICLYTFNLFGDVCFMYRHKDECSVEVICYEQVHVQI